ncbi:MBL fold metallo-hydrolase [Paenibacillus donghaensis]|uniref:MBL fold metallo-hydrolase n=1 Tax=Paenibacillus donghaensis TaxID=414771 RepID=UPI002AD473BD|nr:MBL fold metallo-hydrolase [Paenibacillus donghaensis]
MMELKVWGGAGEHGRSCYVLTGDQHRIMFDCGVKKEGTGEYPLLQEGLIPQLTTVFLSHAHEDHSMALPLLYKHGYQGEIWTTRPTVLQLELYFANWRKYVAGRGGDLPYDLAHISAMRFRILEEEVEPGGWLQLKEGLKLQWGRSGHMLGSVWLRLQMGDNQLFYSGDFSRESALLAVDLPGDSNFHHPSNNHPLSQETSLSIIDNAYGTDEESQDQKLNALRRFIHGVGERGGHVLLPVPAFGRGQELLIWALNIFPGQHILVEQEIFDGLHQIADWQDWVRPEALHYIEEAMNSPHVHVPSSQDERLRLLQGKDPLIIFTTDGMMESPRARWYAERLSSSTDHAIVITGHASEGTFARRLLKGKTEESYCEVVQMGYKIHQGINDVRLMLQEVSSRNTVLVHAPKPETDRVIARLIEEGHRSMFSLEPGAVLNI